MEKQSGKAAQILLKKFEEGKQRNARWSQRAFAKRLGLSSGALSEIMKGKRVLSLQAKKKLAGRLQLSPQEQVEFFDEEMPDHLRVKRLEYVRLSSDQFHLISDWWHYGILNLLNTKGFKPLPAFISQRLGLPLKTVTEAWERLMRLGHLEKSGAKIVRKYPRIETSDGLFDLSIRRAHLEDLKMIEKSLLENPIEIRDHTSLTLTVNKKDLTRAKELIRIFQDQFSEEIEKTPGEEVYRLSISLFPLTVLSEEK
jgi:uncharacterized protein (TIGR02147 family)